MKVVRTMPLIALLALAGTLAAAALATTPSHASLTIRHQLRGCHAWSVNGGAFGASKSITLRHGGSVTVTNNDVMPHQLIKSSGPAVSYTRVARGGSMGMHGTYPPTMLGRMGAVTSITFSKPGVYRFTTKAGEDYMAGVKTIGEDNVLRLTVRVS
jgi:plastocyanin